MTRTPANDPVANPASKVGQQRQRSWLAYAVIALASLLSAVLQPVHADATGREIVLLDTLSDWVEAPAFSQAGPASAP